MPKAKKKLVVEDLPGDESETAKIKGGDGTVAQAGIAKPTVPIVKAPLIKAPQINAPPPNIKGPVGP